MANSYSTTPAQKPPQTSGQKASNRIANSGGKIKAYMDARGAKPASGMGVSTPKPPVAAGGKGDGKGSYGNMAKGRRMGGKPQPNQAAARRKGPKASASFATSNAVPTGGRRTGGNINPPGGGGSYSSSNIKNPNANPSGVRSTTGRLNDFMSSRTPPTKPPQAGVGGIKPPVAAPPASQLRSAVGALKPPAMKPPVSGAPGTVRTMPPTTGGVKPPTPAPTPSIQPVGGTGNPLASGRATRPKMV